MEKVIRLFRSCRFSALPTYFYTILNAIGCACDVYMRATSRYIRHCSCCFAIWMREIVGTTMYRAHSCVPCAVYIDTCICSLVCTYISILYGCVTFCISFTISLIAVDVCALLVISRSTFHWNKSEKHGKCCKWHRVESKNKAEYINLIDEFEKITYTAEGFLFVKRKYF